MAPGISTGPHTGSPAFYPQQHGQARSSPHTFPQQGNPGHVGGYGPPPVPDSRPPGMQHPMGMVDGMMQVGGHPSQFPVSRPPGPPPAMPQQYGRPPGPPGPGPAMGPPTGPGMVPPVGPSPGSMGMHAASRPSGFTGPGMGGPPSPTGQPGYQQPPQPAGPSLENMPSAV